MNEKNIDVILCLTESEAKRILTHHGGSGIGKFIGGLAVGAITTLVAGTGYQAYRTYKKEKNTSSKSEYFEDD